MPDPRVKPVSASDSSTSDEASKLELYLQRQLEEDVARIFDESIYSDLEVVCGKLKILTHSCILKARTNKFYGKLDSILHLNIGREAFDEIYSFISDAYTECDITAQEKDILIFLKSNLFNKSSNNLSESKKSKDDTEDIDVFLTPNSPTSYKEKIFQDLSCLSPSTELTKEYYALVHIEGNLLEQELIEQDALSDAFHTIIKSQDKSITKHSQRSKPTSLSLISSHSPKIIKHSNNCDFCDKLSHDKNPLNNRREIEKEKYNVCMKPFDQYSKIDVGQVNGNESLTERVLEPAYSPDSLITDDPSSSSDYLSAAYTSPALGTSGCLPQINAGENSIKMENIFTSSDSGLENTGMLESLSSHKDVMLTDLSLTESTLHDLTIEDTNHSQESTSSPEADFNQAQKIKLPLHRIGTSSLNSAYQDSSSNGQQGTSNSKSVDVIYGKSSKEEKQRQNEEIVILESSSVSSETGSWESVFPPKNTDKEMCNKFIHNERQFVNNDVRINKDSTQNISEHQNYENFLTKPTPCFIDAASLADEDQISVNLQKEKEQQNVKHKSDNIPVPSLPVPCSRPDISPGDWSESNDNEDSLEQPDNKEPDSIHKDISPTIFEMTPITEDSLSANDVNESKDIFENKFPSTCQTENSISTNTEFTGTTPHNSIMSLKTSSLKQYESEESESDTIVISRESLTNIRLSRFNESSPIVSGGASIEDVRSPKIGTQNNSPSVRRKVENIPIVTGASLNLESNNLPKSPKSVSGSTWIVDMSSTSKIVEVPKSPFSQNFNKKPGDRVCETLKKETKHTNSSEICSKSRSSVDSDSSEKSGHKFYIDLSTLPDPLPPKKIKNDECTEKKNIFSMYIDLGEKSTLKDMPTRLSSSLNIKKQSNDNKVLTKTSKNTKVMSNEKVTSINSSPSSYLHDQINVSTTFERYESLCNDPSITISEIIAIPEPDLKTTKPPSEVENNKTEKQNLRRNGDKNIISNTSFTIQEESTNEQSDLFVKLSDLDKPTIQTTDILEKQSFDARMTRSIPENNWLEQIIASTSRSSEVISSFHSENALSLNRLFPHLKNEFSKSMPISLSCRTRSPLRQGGSSSVGEIDEQVSDVSEISSVQSSMCRSVIENSTTEETSQTSSSIGHCQSRLGQDLLRMFLEEIAPDVIVEVSGKRIKAHKCILSSRCQYFAGILSGGWVESAGNVIVLPPFSFNVVHFALCHIYSGLSTIPDSVSIVELATIADMLGLEGLKEAIMFTLKAKYCHHFHRPCQVCTAGVLECFPLSSVYGLDDLYRKCLRWITKYFTKVWPTKTFATLPKELLDKCYQEHIVNLSTDNIVETVYGCGITVASLQNSRWAEIVARMCRRLVNAAAHFAAPRLLAVLEIISLVPDAPSSAKQALDDCLAAAIEWAPPDETCRAYAFLSTLVRDIRNQHSKPDLINNQTIKIPEPNNLLYTHASSWRLQCEGALVRAAPRVVGTQAFKDLPPDLRRRLRELGCIMYGPQAIPPSASPLQDRKTKSTYQSKPKTINPVTTRSLDMDKVRTSFVPYKPKPVAIALPKEKIPSTSELRDKTRHETKVNNKVTIPKVRTTKAQEERAKFNQTRTLTSQDRSVSNKPVAARLHPFENTKPRYLEPRQCKEREKKTPTKKLVNKMVSSSESSRNSSPIQSRNLKINRLSANQVCEKKTHTMSQDSLATSSRPRTAEPSTDSLSESQNSNKYATYTKTKHTGKGSVESVVSKCQLLSPSLLLNANVKTKIPVYCNQNSASWNGSGKANTSMKGQVCTQSAKTKTRVCDRKVSGSLMSATKSSSAKIVPKVAKEHPAKLCKQQKHTKMNTSNNVNRREELEPIPAMERSGTFLKDEPMFATNSANIDKAQ